MIIDILFYVFNTFATFIINLLPDGELDAEALTSVENLLSDIYGFDYILPIDTIFTVLALSFTFILAMWTWSATKWFIHLIRGN